MSAGAAFAFQDSVRRGTYGPLGASFAEIMPRIVDRLTRVIKTDYIPVWLSRPIEALGDQKPLD